VLVDTAASVAIVDVALVEVVAASDCDCCPPLCPPNPPPCCGTACTKPVRERSATEVASNEGNILCKAMCLLEKGSRLRRIFGSGDFTRPRNDCIQENKMKQGKLHGRYYNIRCEWKRRRRKEREEACRK
jgi:hypothetical protein